MLVLLRDVSVYGLFFNATFSVSFNESSGPGTLFNAWVFGNVFTKLSCNGSSATVGEKLQS